MTQFRRNKKTLGGQYFIYFCCKEHPSIHSFRKAWDIYIMWVTSCNVLSHGESGCTQCYVPEWGSVLREAHTGCTESIFVLRSTEVILPGRNKYRTEIHNILNYYSGQLSKQLRTCFLTNIMQDIKGIVKMTPCQVILRNQSFRDWLVSIVSSIRTTWAYFSYSELLQIHDLLIKILGAECVLRIRNFRILDM